MLHSQGVDLSLLNVPDAKGEVATPRDPREVWRTFAENFHLFRGTPVRRCLFGGYSYIFAFLRTGLR